MENENMDGLKFLIHGPPNNPFHEEELIEDSSMDQTNLPDVKELPLDPSATTEPSTATTEPSTATTTDGNTGLVKGSYKAARKKINSPQQRLFKYNNFL